MRTRIVVILLLVAALLSTATMASPGQRTGCSAEAWERVFEEFGLETVSVIPDGVTPLVVSSPGQLRKLLSEPKKDTVEVSIDASRLRELELLTAGEALSVTETYVDLHATDRHEWPVIFHLEARVWMVGSGSFWEITDCTEHVYFTGWSLFWGHEGEWSDHHIAWNKQSVQVRGGAVFYGYIGIPDVGEIRIYEYRYNLVINYSL